MPRHPAERAELLPCGLFPNQPNHSIAQPRFPVGHLGLGLTDKDVVVRAPGDLRKIAADVIAVRGENLRLVLEPLRGSVEVRVIRILGGDAERLLLAASGNPQGNPTVLRRQREALGVFDRVMRARKGRRTSGPCLPEDVDALGEHSKTLPGGGEAVTVGTPFVLVPAGPDTHFDTASGNSIRRSCELRQVHGIPITHARAHLPESHARSTRGEGGNQRPRLVHRSVLDEWSRVEVVVNPGGIPHSAVIDRGHKFAHARPMLGGVHALEVEPPALRDERSKSHAPENTGAPP